MNRVLSEFIAIAALATALWCAVPPRGVAAQATEEERARALELFRQSADLYRQGRFDEAAALLFEAREIHREPLLAYNLARALESAGDLEGALQAYREYLEEDPHAADGPAVRSRIEALEAQLAEIEALRRRRESEALSAPPSAPRSAEAAPWVIAGAGAAVLVTGAITGGIALSRRGYAPGAPDHAAATAALSDAQTLATVANVCFAAGGLAALIGTIWGIVDVATLPSSSPPQADEGEAGDGAQDAARATDEDDDSDAASARAQVRLAITPTGVELFGSF